MTRAEATQLATERVLAVQLDQYRRGLAPVVADKADKWIAEQARRHADEIARAALELLNPAPAARCAAASCGRDATTAVAGAAYCDAHAATAPRLPRPEGVAA